MRQTAWVFLLVFFPGLVLAAPAPPPARVVTRPVERAQVAENQPFIGTLHFERTSRLAAEVAGRVAGVDFQEGDHLKKDAVLVRLDTDFLDLEIRLARTRLARVGVRIAQAEKDYHRLEKLFAEQGISEKAFEDAMYRLRDLEKEREEIKNSLSTLELKRKKSVIIAPFAGLVLERAVEVGDWLAVGGMVCRLARDNDLTVRVPVAETLVRFARVGEPVAVNITAFDRELTGRISGIVPVAEPRSRTVTLKVDIPARKDVAENMSATVRVPVGEKKELALIPREALIKFQGKDFVYTVKEGKAAILPIHIVSFQAGLVGADNPYFVAGMPVVIEGNERLRPDQQVEVVKAMGK